MVSALRRWFGQQRTDLVRARIFDRKVRVRRGRLPNLDPVQQQVYDRACSRLENYHPVTQKEAR